MTTVAEESKGEEGRFASEIGLVDDESDGESDTSKEQADDNTTTPVAGKLASSVL